MFDACEEGRIEEVREMMKSHPNTIHWENPEKVCLFVCLFVFFYSFFPFLQGGETPLMAASRFGHVEVVKELLKGKANIDAPKKVSGYLFLFCFNS